MDDKEYSPLIAGVSVGPKKFPNWRGTISAIVVQGQSNSPLILSCTHVLDRDGTSKKGAEICHPSGHRKVIARLTKTIVLDNTIDAALAEILDPANAAPGIHMDDGSDIPFTKFADAQGIRSLIDTHGHVRKRGINTLTTSGKIDAGDVTAPMGYPETPLGWSLFGTFRIESTNSSLFSGEMDSGAPVINDANEIVGMLVGGDNKYSYAIPINFIQNQLDISPWNG